MPTLQDRARLALRYDAMSFLWKWSNVERLQQCGRVACPTYAKGSKAADRQPVQPGHAGVSLGFSGDAFSVRGVKRCSSVWICPGCGPKIRTGKAEQVRMAALEHRRRGGSLLFLTLTLPHGRRDGLDTLWDALSGSWSRMIGQEAWKSLGWYVGRIQYSRVIEVNDGPNGWHPHVHALLYVDEDPAQYLEVLRQSIANQWAHHVVKAGWKSPRTDKVGCDLQRVDSPTALSKYLHKVDDGQRIDLELARGDAKRGRSENVTPWQLLRRAQDGDLVALARWYEWERVSSGRRMMTWSQGTLRDYNVEELTDEALAQEATGHQTVAVVPGRVWRAVCDSGRMLILGQALERGDRSKVLEVLLQASLDGGYEAFAAFTEGIEWVGLPDAVPV